MPSPSCLPLPLVLSLLALALLAAPLQTAPQPVPAPADTTEVPAEEAAAVSDAISSEARYDEADDDDSNPGIQFRPRVAPSALYSSSRGFGIGGGVGVRNIGWTGSDLVVDLRLQQSYQAASATLFTGDPYDTLVHGLVSVGGSTTDRRRYYGLGPYTLSDNQVDLYHDAAQAEIRLGAYPLGTTALLLQPGVRYLYDRSGGVNEEASPGSFSALDEVSQRAVRLAEGDPRHALSVGFEVATDLRDWPSYPTSGSFFTAEARRQFALDDHELTLDRYSASAIGYLPIRGRTTFIVRTVGVLTRSADSDGDGEGDDIPFYYLPTLDDRVAAPFKQERLTGRDIIAAGAGVRFPVVDFIGVYGIDALVMGYLGNAYDNVFEQFRLDVSFRESAMPGPGGRRRSGRRWGSGSGSSTWTRSAWWWAACWAWGRAGSRWPRSASPTTSATRGRCSGRPSVRRRPAGDRRRPSERPESPALAPRSLPGSLRPFQPGRDGSRLLSGSPSRTHLPVPLAPRWLYAVKAALAAVAVVVLVRLAHPREVWAAVLHAEPAWALAALALVPVNIGLEAYRWGRLVRRLAPHVRHRDALRAVVGAYPLGLLTPGRVGDYVGRAVYLRAIPAGASAALTFGERMATLAACLVFGLVATVPFLAAQADPSPLWPAVIGVGSIGAGALLLAILFPSVGRAALSAVLPFERVRQSLRAFDRIPPDEAWTLLALSAVRYLVFSTQFVLLVQAFAPGTPWGTAAAGVALVFFAKSAVPQVTLGDLGVREGAAVFFFGAYGVAPAAALDASLSLFALNLVLPALIGTPLLLRLRLPRPDAAPSEVPA